MRRFLAIYKYGKRTGLAGGCVRQYRSDPGCRCIRDFFAGSHVLSIIFRSQLFLLEPQCAKTDYFTISTDYIDYKNIKILQLLILNNTNGSYFSLSVQKSDS